MNNKPVYVSITSIYQRQSALIATLNSIINQTMKPDRIFLYLSEEPYLLDSGFKDKTISNKQLSSIIESNSLIEVVWTKNTGPYRKLLPLLEEKFNEDCLIITIDDDTQYNNTIIETYVNLFNAHQCQIGARATLMDLKIAKDNNYGGPPHYEVSAINNFNTGKGGILYHPSFFHKFNDIIFNNEIYNKLCSTNDDIWFNCLRMCSDVSCYVPKYKYMEKDLHNSHSLWDKFNSLDNQNCKYFADTMLYIEDYLN